VFRPGAPIGGGFLRFSKRRAESQRIGSSGYNHRSVGSALSFLGEEGRDVQTITHGMSPKRRQEWWRAQARIDQKNGGRKSSISAYLDGAERIRHAPESGRKGTPAVADRWYKQGGWASA
jgi:hypothetical protein